MNLEQAQKCRYGQKLIVATPRDFRICYFVECVTTYQGFARSKAVGESNPLIRIAFEVPDTVKGTGSGNPVAGRNLALYDKKLWESLQAATKGMVLAQKLFESAASAPPPEPTGSFVRQPGRELRLPINEPRYDLFLKTFPSTTRKEEMSGDRETVEAFRVANGIGYNVAPGKGRVPGDG